MDSDTVQLRTPRPYRPFLPLFFSLAGWALLQTWLHLVGANFRAHILVVFLGLVFTLWSIFPLERGKYITVEKNTCSPNESRWAAISGTLLLFALGAVLGSLIAKGSLFLLSLAALLLNFLPWARLPLSQRHPSMPCAATLCGFGAAILARYQSIEVIFLPLAAWAFWLCTCVGLILRVEHSRRARRGLAATEVDSSPAAYET